MKAARIAGLSRPDAEQTCFTLVVATDRLGLPQLLWCCSKDDAADDDGGDCSDVVVSLEEDEEGTMGVPSGVVATSSELGRVSTLEEASELQELVENVGEG